MKQVTVTPFTRSHEMVSDVLEVESTDTDNAASVKDLQHEFNTIKISQNVLVLEVMASLYTPVPALLTAATSME